MDEHSICQKIYNEIKDFVLQEDNTLKQLGCRGIYHAPELAIAYEIGKRIISNKKTIFDDIEVEWLREYSFIGGPSDLSFKCTEGERKTYFTIEFKLAATINDYEADIEKLKLLPSNHIKLACVLIDTFNDDDNRLKLFTDSPFEKLMIIDHTSFITTGNYKQPVTAHLILAQINPKVDGIKFNDEFDSEEDTTLH